MFAADAVARLSGVIGVAVVTAGPGKLKNYWVSVYVTLSL